MVNPKDAAARRVIGSFARTLLATTCLTVAGGGAAVAGSLLYDEGTSLTNTVTPTQLTAASLPGTTTVTGTTDGNNNLFELTGLGTGNFIISVQETDGDDSGSFLYAGPNNGPAGLLVNDESFDDTAVPFGPFAIPDSGDLFVAIQPLDENSVDWSVSVTTWDCPVPEPSALACLGLGLAGALTLARKRRKQ